MKYIWECWLAIRHTIAICSRFHRWPSMNACIIVNMRRNECTVHLDDAMQYVVTISIGKNVISIFCCFRMNSFPIEFGNVIVIRNGTYMYFRYNFDVFAFAFVHRHRL